MAIRSDIKRTKVFKEFSEEENKKFFNCTAMKYVHNIDTLYYSVFLENDVPKNTPSEILLMIEYLQAFKDYLDKNEDNKCFAFDVWFDKNQEILFRRRRFSIYEYCIGVEGYFDIFIAKSLPNEYTPRVVIQLRSIGLWTMGVEKLIHFAYETIKTVTDEFGINILRCQENRIDYAYHTNAIQSPYKFYSDDLLQNNLRTTFKIYNKVGRLDKTELTVEYLSLGQRKSNNVFFRSYNKVREVIEENYKEFFIEYWYKSGLINYYDFIVYSFAYEKHRYDAIEWGMLQFYIKFGKDLLLKQRCNELYNNKNTNLKDIRNLLKGVLPQPTLVMNIEFQTMRKFYFNGENFIDMLPITTDVQYDQLVRVFQIIDNRNIFLDYLTSETVAFKKDKSKDSEYLDFWKRLRSCKVKGFMNKHYTRTYKKNININLLTKRIKSSLATLALYKGQDMTDINEDMSLLINILNDNDMKINDDGTCTILDNEYIKIKDKKKKALNSILKHTDLRPSQINLLN